MKVEKYTCVLSTVAPRYARTSLDDPSCFAAPPVFGIVISRRVVAEVLDVIRELAAGGMTMVIATHEMGFARDIAGRVAFLDDGRILELGPPEQVLRDPREPRTRQFLQRIIDAGRL